MLRSLSMVLVLLLVATVAVAGGGQERDYEFGIFGGYLFPDSYGSGLSALNPEDDVLYGLRLGYFLDSHWSIEWSLQQASTQTQFAPSLMVPDIDADISSVRLNVLANFRPEQMFRPFVTAGVGLENTDIQGGFDETDGSLNLGAGLRWFAGDSFGFRLDARWITTEVGSTLAARQDNLEATAGILWTFGGQPPTDTDGDGVPDRRDNCPGTPAGAVVDLEGCPVDSDGDGVPDGIDRCPETPAGIQVDSGGCSKDSDGDGVFDGPDKCPGTPGGATVDSSGCPKDSDGDGVFDGLDRCPDTPRGASVDGSGCPKDGDGDGVFDGLDNCPNTVRGATVDGHGCAKDSDADGVYDGLDKCPDTPRGTKVDENGCQLLFEPERQTLILEGVNFEVDSDELTSQAQAILDRVAMSLKQWPEIRVEVGGHTDSSGSDAYNLKLSQRRAESVRAYLGRKGVDPASLTAQGYGESNPIADNATKAGRDRNRRVELKKLN